MLRAPTSLDAHHGAWVELYWIVWMSLSGANVALKEAVRPRLGKLLGVGGSIGGCLAGSGFKLA